MRCTQDLCVQNSGESGENFDGTRGRFNVVQGKVNRFQVLVDRKIGNYQKAGCKFYWRSLNQGNWRKK